MNLRTFTTISAVAMLVLGGCVIVDSTGNTGGSAGAGGGSDTTSSSSSSGTAGAGNTGGNGMGGGGSGGGAACSDNCSDTLTDPTLTPCATASDEIKKLYTELAECVCGAGPCATDDKCKKTTYCGGTDGMGTTTYDECQKCLQDNTATGCGSQVNACAGM
jgi:hypothetical protein